MKMNEVKASTATTELSREDDLLRRSFLLMLRAEGKSLTTIRRYELSVREFQDFARQMDFPGANARAMKAHGSRPPLGETGRALGLEAQPPRTRDGPSPRD